MSDLRSDMASLYAELQQIPVDLGFRERSVVLRSYTVMGANAALQIVGTRTANDTTITPTPKVKDAVTLQDAQRFGGIIEEGDLEVSSIPRTYTEDQLRNAEEWLVDSKHYRLLRLVRLDTSWQAFLRKAKS